MSRIESIEISEAAKQLPLAREPLDRLDRFAIAASDYINPIMIRETRQALKSRQFGITFGLMLIAALGWSFLGIALAIPGIYYLPGGPAMLMGYCVILLLPTMVVVPFAAHRSLAAEMEEGTYDLLSVSTLTSWQIVTGKLASAVLQLVVYYAAIAPCMAFTFLLRGVSVSTIAMLLLIGMATSVMLCVFALLMATVGRSRAIQVFSSVILLIALVAAAFYWGGMSIALIYEADIVFEGWAWLVTLAIAMAYISYFFLGLLAAAGQISFASENRSTKLRWVMLIQQLMLVVWLFGIAGFIEPDDGRAEVLTTLMIVSAVHWGVMGALMMGESGVISPRAQRTLPRSFLGRMAFNWFVPGAGIGYFFVLISYASLMFCCCIVVASLQIPARDVFMPVEAGFVSFCYLAIYLGMNRLLMLLLGRLMPARMLGAVALNVVTLMIGQLGPFIIVFWLNDFREYPYDWHQMTNVIWTFTELLDKGAIDWYIGIPLGLLAFMIAAINLALVGKDVLAIRIETPERVIEETGKGGVKKSVDVVVDPLAWDS